jgi:hypothetical protein
MLRFAMAIALSLAIEKASPVMAATTVYHCTVNGQTVLTDKPCDTPPAAEVVLMGPNRSVQRRR